MKQGTIEEYRAWVESQDWYQTMVLKDNIVTAGSVRTDLREEWLAEIDVSGKRVLDIGCNSGQYCLWAKKHGALEVVGIDLDSRRLEQAATIAEYEEQEIQYHKLGLSEAPLLGSFDVVYCFAVLTEIPDFSNAMAALRQLVNGRAILELDLARPLIAVPGMRALRERRGWGELRRNKRGDWIVSPTLRTLKKVFGNEFEVKRGGKGVRYDLIHVQRLSQNPKQSTGRPGPDGA